MVCFVAMVAIRIQMNPLHKLPGPPLVDPIFGCFSSFALIRDCQCIKTFKEYRLNYGCVRRAYVLFGGIRLDIADPYWIKVKSVSLSCCCSFFVHFHLDRHLKMLHIF